MAGSTAAIAAEDGPLLGFGVIVADALIVAAAEEGVGT